MEDESKHVSERLMESRSTPAEWAELEKGMMGCGWSPAYITLQMMGYTRRLQTNLTGWR